MPHQQPMAAVLAKTRASTANSDFFFMTVYPFMEGGRAAIDFREGYPLLALPHLHPSQRKRPAEVQTTLARFF